MGGILQRGTEWNRSSKLPRAAELGYERGGCGGDMTGSTYDSNAQYEKGKAIRAEEVRLDMMEMAGEVGFKWTGRLLNVCMLEGRIPKEWMMGLIVPIWKRKGDETDGEGFRRKDQEKSIT